MPDDEVRRIRVAAMEECAKAMCWYCENGFAAEGSGHATLGGLVRCDAAPIRRLIEREREEGGSDVQPM